MLSNINNFKFDKIVFKILSETHYTDIFTKSFLEFIKKYKKQKKDNTLYVQFTNFSGSTLEKTPYSTPDHNDPVGIYAYPLKYVIDYPADVKYGRSAKYLRILKRKDINSSLNLGLMEYWLAKSLLSKIITKEDPERLLLIAQKTFKYPNNKTRYAKQFFANIQYDLTEKIQTDSKIPYRLRSGEEQTKLLLSVGITSLIDTSGSRKLAVINKSEPEQAIFLNRKSFDVIEVFQLRSDISKNLIKNPDGNIDLAQKMASSILIKINDNISEASESKHEKVKWGGSRSYDFFSKKGFHLKINYEAEIPEKWSFDEPTQHRDAKEYTRYYPIIELYSDKPFIKRKFDRSHTIEQISDYIAREYNQGTRDNPDFKPLTKKTYEEQLKRKKDEEIVQRIKKEKEEDYNYEKDFRESILNKLIKKLNLNITLEETDSTLYHKALQYLLRKLSRLFSVGEIIDKQKLDELWKQNDLLFTLNRENSNVNNLKIIFNSIMLNKELERNRIHFIIRDILGF
jgi:hypothetical protein